MRGLWTARRAAVSASVHAVTLLATVCLAATMALSCTSVQPGPDEVSMVLPVGSPEYGEMAFRALRCGACHRVEGIPELSHARRISQAPTLIPGNPEFTAGELATAIVAPGHEATWKEGDPVSDTPLSEMPDYYDLMTVGDLMDLVAFLEGTPGDAE